MAKDSANLDSLGMRAISMIDCTGMNEEWDYVGVEGWPSNDAISEREKFENDVLNISNYVSYKTIIGTQQSFKDYGKQDKET